MRKYLFLPLLATVLAATLVPTPANAAVRVGGSCTKVGATVKAGAKTLKCSPKRKWVLFTPSTKPKTPTAPSPQPTPTPTTVRISLGESCHAKVNATLQRLVNGLWVDLAAAQGWDLTPGCTDPTAFRPWTLANAQIGDTLRWRVYTKDWEWLSRVFTYQEPIKPYQAATSPDSPIKDFASVATAARDSVQTIPIAALPNKVEIKNEPGIQSAVLEFTKGAATFAMKYLASLLPANITFNVLSISTRDWGLTNALTYAPDNKFFVDDMNRTFPQWGNSFRPGCKGGGGFSVGYLDNPLLVIDHPCDLVDDSTSLIAHEFTHSVQSKYGQTRDPQCVAPKWFVEGQAQVFGAAFAYNMGPKWREARTAMTRKQETPYPDIMKDMEPDTLRGQEYSNGMLMVEYLVARSGWKKSMDVITEASRIIDRGCLSAGGRMTVFKESFKTVYGQSLDDFYSEVYPYLQWSFANKN